jgi:hypothetical protein
LQTPWLSDIQGAGYRLLNTGNVGIGNTLPALPDASTADIHLIVGSTTATAWGEITTCANVTAGNSVVGILNFANYNLAATEKRIAAIVGATDGAANSGILGFDTMNAGTITERMRITSAGNVGIGTVSPTNKLTVTSTASIDGVSITSLNRASIYLNVTNGSSYNWAVQNAVSSGVDLQFLASTAAGGAATTNVMTLLAGGNVGLGDPSPTHQLVLSTDSAAKPATNTWTIYSDARLKQNAQWLKGGLPIIEQIHPVDAEYNGLHGTKQGARVVSVVVEELRKILPGCVPSHKGKLRATDTEETEILDFNSHEILFHLILAVQQLSRRLKALEGTSYRM